MTVAPAGIATEGPTAFTRPSWIRTTAFATTAPAFTSMSRPAFTATGGGGLASAATASGRRTETNRRCLRVAFERAARV